jgi:ABC-type transport system involved in multi-copper enzyme maturation permease subunit
MLWLTWRQFRLQTQITLAALAVLSIYLIIQGRGIQDFYETEIVGCQGEACSIARAIFEDRYEAPIVLIGALLLGIPALIGVFWGAPLIAREFETGTHRLVWNQSVTRTRWLAVKLTMIALFSLVVTGLLSLLLSWAAQPFDKILGSRFGAMTFDSRDIAPLGYAVFAFALGTTIGLLIRRTLPAMALTLAIFATVQVVMPAMIRPHLMSPITAAEAVTAETIDRAQGFGFSGEDDDGSGNPPMSLFGYTKPGAWVVSAERLPILKADGSAYTQKENEACFTGTPAKDFECLAAKNLHFDLTYHPASRYWTFQWIETAIFLGLALALAGVCFWRIPRGVN